MKWDIEYAAMRELRAENERLKTEIAELKAEIARLQDTLKRKPCFCGRLDCPNKYGDLCDMTAQRPSTKDDEAPGKSPLLAAGYGKDRWQELKQCLSDIMSDARQAIIAVEHLQDAERRVTLTISPGTHDFAYPRIECPGECCDDYTRCLMPCAPTRERDARAARRLDEQS